MLLRRVMRLLGSLVGLAMLAAVPFALLQIWRGPLADVPPSDQWQALSRGELRPEMVLAALSVLVALAWARVAVAVVVELIALVRHRPAPSLRGLGSGQRLAAFLVGGLTAVTVSVPRPMTVQPARATAVTEPSPTPSAPVNGVAGHHEPWVVPQRDTLWNLAERTLGDGGRWREIVAANRGHEVAPGLQLDEQTSLVHAGWQLRLPSDAAVPATMPHVPATVMVERGDTLSGIAAAHLGDARAWPEIWEANKGREFEGRHFHDPNLIYPGWILEVPGGTAEAPPIAEPQTDPSSESLATTAVDVPLTQPLTQSPLDEPPTTESSSDAEPADGAGSVQEDSAVSPVIAASPDPETDADQCVVPPTADSEPSESAVVPTSGDFPLPLPAALLVAAGAVGLIDALRRQQQRRASIGARFPAADAQVARTEQHLRSLAVGERLTRLDLALRAAAAMLAPSTEGHRDPTTPAALVMDAGPVVVHAVLLGADGSAELLLSGAAWPKEPFVVGVNPNRWLLPAGVELTTLAPFARTAGVPCPALVQVGTSRGAEVFVDVEAWGTLGIDVIPERAAVVLQSMVADLSLSPFAQQVEVLVVGLEDVDGLPRVSAVDDAESAIELAITATTGVRAATRSGTTTFALRARAQGETWEPALLVLGDGTHPEIPAGQGLAALVVGRPEVGCWLTERDGSWWLEPLGLPLVPVGAALDEIRAIRAVLDHASVEAEAPQPDDGAGMLRGAVPQPVSEQATEPFREPPWEMLVRVLGSPVVESASGTTVTFDRSKALELVVWLSQHRRRSTRSLARTALWELEVRDATFANVVSDARRAMARCAAPPDGEEWIGRTLTEDLPLHPLVITDAELVQARLHHAADQDHVAAVHTLEPAVELLRGMPLEGTAYGWADAEGLSSNLVMLAVSAAAKLARHHLALGDLPGVFAATAQGLQVLPGHDDLLALRMRAHARTGDVAGLRAEWAAYERALATDPWADDPSEKLVLLRQELLAGLASRPEREPSA